MFPYVLLERDRLVCKIEDKYWFNEMVSGDAAIALGEQFYEHSISHWVYNGLVMIAYRGINIPELISLGWKQAEKVELNFQMGKDE